MDRLFKRNKEYTKLLIEGADTYSRKKERRKFERYVYTFIGKEYKKSAATYFSEAATRGYLDTILDLSGKLEQLQALGSEENKAQRWELIQALSIGIRKPKLLFDSNEPVKYKTVHKFEVMLQKIYRELDEIQEELDLCNHYMQRGTTRLDRSAEKNRLSQEKREAMADDVDKVYRAYFYQLKALGLDWIAEFPTVRRDPNLFPNVTEKPWLIPVAHVMLIRDAQAQMIGKAKYKNSALFFDQFDFLNKEKFTKDQQKGCDALTLYYALRIRDILAKYLENKKRSDCRAAFSDYYKEKDKQKRKEIESDIWYKMGISLPASVAANNEYMDKMSIFKVPDFSVPACRVKETALIIAKQLQLPPSELGELEKVIPDALWSQSALEKSLSTFRKDVRDRLVERLKPLRTLVNAKEYYSDAKGESTISKNILDAAAKIYADSYDGTNIRGNDAKMAAAWNVYKDMLYFEDLTRGTLLLSRAVDPCTAPSKIWFDFFSHCKSDLHRALKKYQSSLFLKDVLKISNIRKGVLQEVRCDEKYAELRKELMICAANVKSENDLSLEKASQFLKQMNSLSAKGLQGDAAKNKNTTQWQERIDRLLSTYGQNVQQSWDQEHQEHLCFEVYTCLAQKAVSIFEDYVMGVLFSNVIGLYQRGTKKEKGTKMEPKNERPQRHEGSKGGISQE